ncbi:MAG: NAD(P)H-dependent oxidoreductase [Tenericutes bacterium]|nr:NAD(P)H-dependent oxidoreductase [Mycoplasmatota bacterium]
MDQKKLKIGIILGSTRKGRVSPQVGSWVKKLADQRDDADYEIVDTKEYNLPLLGETSEKEGILRWREKLDSLDGFIFIVPEYNHGMPGALKNALDQAREPWFNKAAGLVSYGSAGGTRSAEQLRGVLAEHYIATIREHVVLSTFTDFENHSVFKPQDHHKDQMEKLFEQLLNWASALKPLRS